MIKLQFISDSARNIDQKSSKSVTIIFSVSTLVISVVSYKFNSRIIFRVLVLVVISRDGLFLFPAYVCKQKFLDILLFAQPLMNTKPISDIKSLISLNWSNHFPNAYASLPTYQKLKIIFSIHIQVKNKRNSWANRRAWQFFKLIIGEFSWNTQLGSCLKKGLKREKRGIGVW